MVTENKTMGERQREREREKDMGGKTKVRVEEKFI